MVTGWEKDNHEILILIFDEIFLPLVKIFRTFDLGNNRVIIGFIVALFFGCT